MTKMYGQFEKLLCNLKQFRCSVSEIVDEISVANETFSKNVPVGIDLNYQTHARHR